ncbi:MAG: hypothetical protein AAF919_11970 [Pseudomonadota bacterium]
MSKEIIAAAVLLSSASTAWADLSAPAIWADWQQYYSSLGGTLSAEAEDYADGTLTLTDISASFEIAGQTSAAQYGSIALEEQADGSVRILLPERLEGSSTTTVDGETITQDFVVTQQDLNIIVREDGPEGRVYDMAGAQVVYEVSGLSSGADTPPATVTVTMEGLSAETSSRPEGVLTVFDQDGTLETMTLGVVVQDQIDLTYILSDMTADGSATIETGEGNFLQPGSQSAVSSTLTHSGGTLEMTGVSPQGPFQINGGSDGGRIAVSMDAEQLTYDLASEQSRMNMTLPAFPAPVALTLGSAETNLTFPISSGPEPKPYALRLAYEELALDDTIWSIFDPTGQLPRDPATLVIDLDGTADVAVDFFDPQAFENLQGPPLMPQSMAINTLNLALAGAALTGSGDLSFTSNGLAPQPVGTIELALDGGFALLDGLVAMGVLPQQQAGFFRGMAGTVAQQVGEDRLETVIEFTPEGGITANGMPLR